MDPAWQPPRTGRGNCLPCTSLLGGVQAGWGEAYWSPSCHHGLGSWGAPHSAPRHAPLPLRLESWGLRLTLVCGLALASLVAQQALEGRAKGVLTAGEAVRAPPRPGSSGWGALPVCSPSVSRGGLCPHQLGDLGARWGLGQRLRVGPCAHGGLQLWGLPTACHLPCFPHGPAGLSAWQGAERDSWSVPSGSVPTTPL